MEKTWLLRLMSMSNKERDRVVLLKFNGEFDIRMTTIEVVHKLICCVDVVEQSIVNISKPNRRASVVAENPFLLKMAHKDVG